MPEHLSGRLDALDAALSELRLQAGEGSGERPPEHLCARLEAVEGALTELRLQRAGTSGEGLSDDLLHRLDAVEGALTELRLAPAQGNDPGAAALGLRLQTLEGALTELRLEQNSLSGAEALLGQLDQRFGELEGALSELRLPLARLCADQTGPGPQESRAQLQALEAAMAEQRLSLQQLSDGLLAPPQGRAPLEALEAVVSEERLAVKHLADAGRQQHQELRQEFEALEGIISDQRHALHKLVTSFDSQRYTQRLELQKRLSALDTELRGMLTAIEAGISDQRYALVKLAGSLSAHALPTGADTPGGEGLWEGHTPVHRALPVPGDPAIVELGRLPAVGSRYQEIEHKLGIVLDCLLADHLGGLARAGKDDGNLDPQAFQRLTDALAQLKLERLRARYPDIDGGDRGGQADDQLGDHDDHDEPAQGDHSDQDDKQHH